MVNLEQIQKLEDRVDRAVKLIGVLREENGTLRTTLESAQGRIAELEKLITAFKGDQAEIERGILNAINRLDSLEDDLHSSDGEPAEEAAPAPKAQSESSSREAEEPAGDSVSVPADESDEPVPPEEGELGIF